MTRIRDMTEKEIREGIERCNGRLSGRMPLGWMTRERVIEAKEQYSLELQKRGQKELELT